MDAHLVDVKTLFDFQFSLQEMTQWTKSEDQNKIIQNHMEFWRLMPALYEELNQRLQEKQQGTLGFIFREAVANLEFYLNQTNKYHYFVGFNALNESEAQIIQEFISRNKEKSVGTLITISFMTRLMPPGNSFVGIMQIGNPYAPNLLHFKSTMLNLKKLNLLV